MDTETQIARLPPAPPSFKASLPSNLISLGDKRRAIPCIRHI